MVFTKKNILIIIIALEVIDEHMIKVNMNVLGRRCIPTDNDSQQIEDVFHEKLKELGNSREAVMIGDLMGKQACIKVMS